jgi:hypothetical protein
LSHLNDRSPLIHSPYYEYDFNLYTREL